MTAKSIDELRAGQQKLSDDFTMRLEELQMNVNTRMSTVDERVTKLSVEMAAVKEDLTYVKLMLKQLLDQDDLTYNTAGESMGDGFLPTLPRRDSVDTVGTEKGDEIQAQMEAVSEKIASPKDDHKVFDELSELNFSETTTYQLNAEELNVDRGRYSETGATSKYVLGNPVDKALKMFNKSTEPVFEGLDSFPGNFYSILQVFVKMPQLSFAWSIKELNGNKGFIHLIDYVPKVFDPGGITACYNGCKPIEPSTSIFDLHVGIHEFGCAFCLAITNLLHINVEKCIQLAQLYEFIQHEASFTAVATQIGLEKERRELSVMVTRGLHVWTSFKPFHDQEESILRGHSIIGQADRLGNIIQTANAGGTAILHDWDAWNVYTMMKLLRECTKARAGQLNNSLATNQVQMLEAFKALISMELQTSRLLLIVLGYGSYIVLPQKFIWNIMKQLAAEFLLPLVALRTSGRLELVEAKDATQLNIEPRIRLYNALQVKILLHLVLLNHGKVVEIIGVHSMLFSSILLKN